MSPTLDLMIAAEGLRVIRYPRLTVKLRRELLLLV
ncbi:hypothetical protein MPC4_320029 [Methylocella tundrae]|uniref:Uncharacterized protein n=1 Tax=Methylocella tundrae TaxID=227605 RepID=A0A8B6M8T4_METTU|nr:hypothetical protein MPC4_320029 [Methylocella tundrae]